MKTFLGYAGSAVLVAALFSACGGGGGGGGGTGGTGGGTLWPLPTPDRINAIATDASGNIFVAGPRQPANNVQVSYVAEFNPKGQQLFNVEIQNLAALSMAVDQQSGAIYVTGHSDDPQTQLGQMALVKFDSKGQQQWFQTIKRTDPNKPGGLGAESVALDGKGNAYIAGISDVDIGGQTIAATEDMIVAKLDPSGTVVWVKLIGAPDPGSATVGYGVASDAQGNVYAAGHSDAAFTGTTNAGDWDILTVMLDTDGNLKWARELGTPAADDGSYVAADAAGNVYVAGNTMGDLEGTTNAGGHDVVVAKFDSTGKEQWSRQIGSDQSDVPNGLVLDAQGNPIITGTTEGNYDGAQNTFPSNYSSDFFVSKFDPTGKEIDPTTEYGTDESDQAWGVAVAPKGTIYVGGESGGKFKHTGAGVMFDAGPDPQGFIARFGSDLKTF